MHLIDMRIIGFLVKYQKNLKIKKNCSSVQNVLLKAKNSTIYHLK